jgi:hypothetical protein
LRQSYLRMVTEIWEPADRSGRTDQDVRNWMKYPDREKPDGEWLLILDNLTDSVRLEPLLPPGQIGNILCTSINAGLTSRFRHFADIEELEDDDAVTLLLRAADYQPQDSQNRAEGLRVVHALGNLPLAIDQAGVYIEQKHCGLDGYLQSFAEAREQFKQPELKGSSDRNKAVYATFNISYKAIEELAAQVLDKKTRMQPSMPCSCSTLSAFFAMISSRSACCSVRLKSDGSRVVVMALRRIHRIPQRLRSSSALVGHGRRAIRP